MAKISKSKITPCLWFNGNAGEAAKFYVSIFKNSKITGKSYYDPGSSNATGMSKDSVMTVTFVLDGQEFMGLNGGPQFKFSEAVSFMVNCDTQKEIDSLWSKLSAGGKEVACGWLTDKFGLSWQIVPTIIGKMLTDKDRKKTARVMAEVMKMVKLDIKTLQRAYEGK